MPSSVGKRNQPFIELCSSQTVNQCVALSSRTDKLLESIFQIESTFNLPVWIERVPSQSNPADLLSREVITEFGDAAKIEVDPWEMWNEAAK